MCNLLTALLHLHCLRRGNKTRDFSSAVLPNFVAILCSSTRTSANLFFFLFLLSASQHINGNRVPPCRTPASQCWLVAELPHKPSHPDPLGINTLKHISKTQEIPYVWCCSCSYWSSHFSSIWPLCVAWEPAKTFCPTLQKKRQGQKAHFLFWDLPYISLWLLKILSGQVTQIANCCLTFPGCHQLPRLRVLLYEALKISL